MTDLSQEIAVVTGGSGVLGKHFCAALARVGAKVALLGSSLPSAKAAAACLLEQGYTVYPYAANVLDRDSLETTKAAIHNDLGKISILVNGAGGNRPSASSAPDQTFFEIDMEAVQYVMNLNFHGTVLASQVFGKDIAEAKLGSIINISSMAAERPMTRVASYAAAKAAVENFTKWLATHLALEYGAGVRVNAIAPGFFSTEQNKYLLFNPDGSSTERAQSILNHTPQGRFGNPEDLESALLWLVSSESKFVTGTIISVDGGFGAFTGV